LQPETARPEMHRAGLQAQHRPWGLPYKCSGLKGREARPDSMIPSPEYKSVEWVWKPGVTVVDTAGPAKDRHDGRSTLNLLGLRLKRSEMV